jgi:hypothetical protein
MICSMNLTTIGMGLNEGSVACTLVNVEEQVSLQRICSSQIDWHTLPPQQLHIELNTECISLS